MLALVHQPYPISACTFATVLSLKRKKNRLYWQWSLGEHSKRRTNISTHTIYSFTSQGLSLTVYAAGLLHAAPPPGWLHAMLTTASGRGFRGFGPQSMALLAYGACVLLRGIPPMGWLHAFHDALDAMPQVCQLLQIIS